MPGHCSKRNYSKCNHLSVLSTSLFMLTLFLESMTPADFPSDSYCRLAIGLEGMDKYSSGSGCICFVAHDNQSNPRQALTSYPAKKELRQSSASSNDPSNQERTARVRNYASEFQNDTPPTLSPAQHKLQEGKKKRERWECPARPPILRSASFLKASAVPPLRWE